ncbi:MAG: VWA domain-containing protein [Deltaproteobacteria bacterium]|nr:VWA domain-containing protein [Deltaproteobacteria bacterium]
MSGFRYFLDAPPFSMIVGHDLLKKALIFNAIDPGIGGVLIRGEKGTGKTTAVRSLAQVLPEKDVAVGCRFSCFQGGDLCAECADGNGRSYERRRVDVVELPLNASEDRVLGSIDIEGVLRGGERSFEMGVLGAANGNVLYIDEVNLLEDNIVDILLDVSVSGINRVRREGVSFDHPSRFILVGSMNPEEGEIRPQFLDRFGLSVEVGGFSSPDMRREVVDRVLRWEKGDGVGELLREDEELRGKIEEARKLLPEVEVDDADIERVCDITSGLHLYGLRGDIILMKVARASSAYRGKNEIDPEGLADGFRLSLPHRLKMETVKRETIDKLRSILEADVAEGNSEPQALTNYLQSGVSGHTMILFYKDEVGKVSEKRKPIEEKKPKKESRSSGSRGDTSREKYKVRSCENPNCDLCQGYVDSREFDPEEEFNPRFFKSAKDRIFRRKTGKRSVTKTDSPPGRYVSSTERKGGKVAIDATIRSAASSDGHGPGKLSVRPQDLMYKRYEKKTGNLILFLLDASSSIETQQKIGFLKSTVLSVLKEAYIRRDRVAIISFRDYFAEVILEPTGSIQKAMRMMENIRSGGTTPLSIGLYAALKMMEKEKRKSKESPPYLILLTDGNANISAFGNNPFVESIQLSRKIKDMGVTSCVVDVARMNLAMSAVRRALEGWEVNRGSSDIFYSGQSKMLAEALGGEYLSLGELIRETQVELLKGRHRIV